MKVRIRSPDDRRKHKGSKYGGKEKKNADRPIKQRLIERKSMAFFQSAINILQTLVVAIGAGLGVWGAINLMEGYGNDNRATRS